jgi:hypothetical protein
MDETSLPIACAPRNTAPIDTGIGLTESERDLYPITTRSACLIGCLAELIMNLEEPLDASLAGEGATDNGFSGKTTAHSVHFFPPPAIASFNCMPSLSRISLERGWRVPPWNDYLRLTECIRSSYPPWGKGDVRAASPQSPSAGIRGHRLYVCKTNLLLCCFPEPVI